MKLTDIEARVIQLYAKERIYKYEAEEIYHKHIKDHIAGDRNKCPEMEFMSECLSPCPDYGYKATLRKRITEKQ